MIKIKNNGAKNNQSKNRNSRKLQILNKISLQNSIVIYDRKIYLNEDNEVIIKAQNINRVPLGTCDEVILLNISDTCKVGKEFYCRRDDDSVNSHEYDHQPDYLLGNYQVIRFEQSDCINGIYKAKYKIPKSTTGFITLTNHGMEEGL